jgi:hypothetical protein
VCDHRTPRRGPRPRWASLYAIVGAAAVATALARTFVPVSLLRAAALVVILLIAGLAMVAWVAMNRVAFDLADWCSCAGSTVRVRVIGAAPPPHVTPATARPFERTTLRG